MKYSHVINFPALTFTSPGEYLYTIKELTPSSEVWEVDNRIYRVIITVTKDETGGLVASLDYPDGLPEFVNKYRHCPSPIPPCNPCKCFDKLAFPMLWFLPPQRPEFMALIKKSPEIFDEEWWDRFFEGICDSK